MIPLDDLLPTNDQTYTPPPDHQYFQTGSPFWEFSDIYKWPNNNPEFQYGYYAALYETMLKTGKPFQFTLLESLEPYLNHFTTRAQQYNRKYHTNKPSHWTTITVEGHQEN